MKVSTHLKIKKILLPLLGKRRVEISFSLPWPGGHWAVEEGFIYYCSPRSLGEHPLEDWKMRGLLKGVYYLLLSILRGVVSISHKKGGRK